MPGRRCEACGAGWSPPQPRFCGSCGHRLGTAARPSTWSPDPSPGDQVTSSRATRARLLALSAILGLVVAAVSYAIASDTRGGRGDIELPRALGGPPTSSALPSPGAGAPADAEVPCRSATTTFLCVQWQVAPAPGSGVGDTAVAVAGRIVVVTSEAIASLEPEGPHVAWRRRLAGVFGLDAGPTGDRVLISSIDGIGVIDITTGDLVWWRRFLTRGGSSAIVGVWSPKGEIVATDQGVLATLDPVTGAVRGRLRLRGRAEFGSVELRRGAGAFGKDRAGHTLALDARRGILWRDGGAVVAADGDHVVLARIDGRIVVRRLHSGQVVGQVAHTTGPFGTYAAVDGRELWVTAVGADGAEVHALRLGAHGLERRWTTPLRGSAADAPTPLGDRVYLGRTTDAALVAFDAASGAIVQQVRGLPGSPRSPVPAGDVLLVPLRRSGLAAISDAGNVRWTLGLPGEVEVVSADPPIMHGDGLVTRLTDAAVFDPGG